MSIGIDIGLDGAIAFVVGKHAELFKMPTIKIGKTKRWYDAAQIWNILVYYAETQTVFIEKQQAFRKQGVSSTFKLGRGFGLIEGICVGLNMRYQIVAPKTWQKEILKDVPGEGKERAILVAGRLFPKVSLIPERCRTPHSGYADALCIAEYGRRILYEKES